MSRETEVVVNITKPLVFTEDALEGIAVSAIEGGTGYWACVERAGERTTDYIAMEVLTEAGLDVYDAEEVQVPEDLTEENKLGVFNLETLKEGLQKMANWPDERYRIHYARVLEAFIEGTADADDADLVMQISVLGEHVISHSRGSNVTHISGRFAQCYLIQMQI